MLFFEVYLSNVELKASAFDGLQLPLRVKRGVVGSITLKVTLTMITPLLSQSTDDPNCTPMM